MNKIKEIIIKLSTLKIRNKVRHMNIVWLVPRHESSSCARSLTRKIPQTQLCLMNRMGKGMSGNILLDAIVLCTWPKNIKPPNSRE